jgi:hypothetical protein
MEEMYMTQDDAEGFLHLVKVALTHPKGGGPTIPQGNQTAWRTRSKRSDCGANMSWQFSCTLGQSGRPGYRGWRLECYLAL